MWLELVLRRPSQASASRPIVARTKAEGGHSGHRIAAPHEPRKRPPMALFSRDLLTQIEAGALNSKSDLATLLRRCVSLGGHTGSSELSDWARRELDGYRVGDPELPAYRRVNAPLLLDGFHNHAFIQHHQISLWELPDVARERWSSGLEITSGVGELTRVAGKKEATGLQMPGMDDLVYIMNRSPEYQTWSISRLYYSVSPVVFHGILDTIRTNLVALVAEMRVGGVQRNGLPTAAAADRALNVVLKGRARATFNTAIGDGASASMTLNETAPESPQDHEALPSWVRRPATVIGGVVALLAGIAGIASWIGWSPFT